MADEIYFLKKRAIEFWQRAQEDFDKTRYNLSALDTEQAVQLWLKHLIFLKAGDFPKTHYLDSLIANLREIYQAPSITDFYQQHILQFRSLEDAYLTSRYLPKEFSRLESKKLIDFAKEFFIYLEKNINAKFI